MDRGEPPEGAPGVEDSIEKIGAVVAVGTWVRLVQDLAS